MRLRSARNARTECFFILFDTDYIMVSSHGAFIGSNLLEDLLRCVVVVCQWRIRVFSLLIDRFLVRSSKWIKFVQMMDLLWTFPWMKSIFRMRIAFI